MSKRPPKGTEISAASTINGKTMSELVDERGALSLSAHDLQHIILPMPRGDVKLADGRILRRVIGYDVRNLPDDPRITARERRDTFRTIKESKGWYHEPSDFFVSASINITEDHGELLHVAMSYKDHDPTWDEIKLVRDFFFPDFVDCMMMLPRKELFVNLQPHCYHVWQCPKPWNIG